MSEVTVSGDDKDVTITIKYTSDAPVDPGHNTDPGKPGDDKHPTKPDDKPGNHDDNKPGDKGHDHGNKPTKPGQARSTSGESGSAATRLRTARARTNAHLHAAQLPQTGAANENSLGMVLLIMTNILALLGSRPKKKH